MILVDHYGTEIMEGSRVAYNYSGYVRLGTVEEIAMGHRYNRPRPIIKVRQQGASMLSEVRDTENLVVLEQPL